MCILKTRCGILRVRHPCRWPSVKSKLPVRFSIRFCRSCSREQGCLFAVDPSHCRRHRPLHSHEPAIANLHSLHRKFRIFVVMSARLHVRSFDDLLKTSRSWTRYFISGLLPLPEALCNCCTAAGGSHCSPERSAPSWSLALRSC